MLKGEGLELVKLPLLAQQGLRPDTPMTCDTCEENEECEFSFDAYNTNGDCLMSK